MVGDVVIAPIPFTDLSSTKIRPLVVVAYVGMNDWILCEVTSSRQGRLGNIPITQGDMRAGVLRRDSIVRANRLYTLNERLFRQTVGRLSDSKLAEILAAVRSVF